MINSVSNTKVKAWARLKQRKGRSDSGLFIIQQPHLITEAIKAEAVDTLLIRQGCDNPFKLTPQFVSDSVMRKLSTNVSLNDYLAICRQPEYDKINFQRVIVLENVQDPGNVGTIIRTAVGFGYDAVFLDEGCADVYNEKTIAASQGALFGIPLIRQDMEKTMAALRANRTVVIATTPHQADPLLQSQIPDQYALVFGNEGTGLSDKLLADADQRIKIEMDNFESLNVAVAAAITAYYFRYSKRLK